MTDLDRRPRGSARPDRRRARRGRDGVHPALPLAARRRRAAARLAGADLLRSLPAQARALQQLDGGGLHLHGRASPARRRTISRPGGRGGRQARFRAAGAPRPLADDASRPPSARGCWCGTCTRPKRFYNMLRVAKPTSPMSIGTWILMAFTGGGPARLRRRGGWGRPREGASLAAPARATSRMCRRRSPGMGLSVYTASLLSATSTPDLGRRTPGAGGALRLVLLRGGRCRRRAAPVRARPRRPAHAGGAWAPIALDLRAGRQRQVQERRLQGGRRGGGAEHVAAGRTVEAYVATGLGVIGAAGAAGRLLAVPRQRRRSRRRSRRRRASPP